MTAKVRPVVVPHTTTVIASEYEVKVPVRWLERGAFNIQATFPLPPPKFLRKLGARDAAQLGLIGTKLKRWQGLARI